ETPAANIQRVNVIVAQFAVARVPEPMPVVMKLRTCERRHRGGPGPKVVIHARGGLTLCRSADGIAAAPHKAASQFYFTELALMNVADRLSQRAVGAILRSALANATEFARHLHDPAAFVHIVADRLLDVDILAGLHRPDRSQGVPVVRRGNENGRDRLV